MKKITGILLLAFVFILPVRAKSIQAYVNYALFNIPGEQPYIETYLVVNNATLQPYQTRNGLLQTSAAVTLLIKQGESLKYINRYNLLSKEAKDSIGLNYSLLDQKRISLPAGDYTLEFTIKDNYLLTDSINSSPIAFQLNFPDTEIGISDIPFIESYTKTNKEESMSKNGLLMIPMVDNYFPSGLNSITFYAEVYHTDKIIPNQGFLVNYSIEDISSGTKLARFSKYSRQKAQAVNALLAEFPLEQLASGNYNILIEVIDQQGNTLASKRSFFQRNNKNYIESMEGLSAIATGNSFVNQYRQDELMEYIRSTHPISSPSEKIYARTLLADPDISNMQKYFLFFWQKRNSLEPEAEWLRYLEQVNKVNKAYGTHLYKGYDTERGRVYLQYGPPNSISQNSNDPSLYPYEIWHYYKLKNQSNRKFIFVNKDQITNEYTLLHSDATGEISNNRWQSELNSRANPNKSIDPDERRPENSYFGSKLQEDFQ